MLRDKYIEALILKVDWIMKRESVHQNWVSYRLNNDEEIGPSKLQPERFIILGNFNWPMESGMPLES